MAQTRLTVNETVTLMIHNWPSITEGRLDALSRVFTCTGDWKKTSTGSYPLLGDSLGSMSEIDAEKKYLAECSKRNRKIDNRDLVRARRDDAKEQFTRDNASLLAEENFFNEFSSQPTFDVYRLNVLPLDTMEPQWKAALVEYCKAVLSYTDEKVLDRCRKQTADSRNRALDDLAVSQTTAKECLARLGMGEKPDEEARKARIADLRFQAKLLGLTLVEA
ncbi:MAG: hypothetical protein EOP83_04675 [Verrucomicrobiaceae bacterium]|nr:MAG: hypothetical protein EOP83_04675 [Verrucomicrobiaceae bacterium]